MELQPGIRSTIDVILRDAAVAGEIEHSGVDD